MNSKVDEVAHAAPQPSMVSAKNLIDPLIDPLTFDFCLSGYWVEKARFHPQTGLSWDLEISGQPDLAESEKT